jgi:acyl-coenzyme A thioesterase PaaI-like protein
VLTATAVEEHTTRRIGLYRVEVRDDQEDLVAMAEGTSYKLGSNIKR